jgi:Leucine-rich repeat (LRR) protein
MAITKRAKNPYTVLEAGVSNTNGNVAININNLIGYTLDNGGYWGGNNENISGDGTDQTINLAVALETNHTIFFCDDAGLISVKGALSILEKASNIDLDNNNLTDSSIEDDFFDLPIKKLILRNNPNLSGLPASLSRIANTIDELSCSFCNFTVIPDVVFDLSSLTNLNFNINSIAVIPDGIAKLTNLKILKIQRLQITQLPNAMAAMTQLETVTMPQNTNLVAIDPVVNEWTKIRSLHLGSCNFETATLDAYINDLWNKRDNFDASVSHTITLSNQRLGAKASGVIDNIAEPPVTPQDKISLLIRDYNFSFSQ